tara:strand:- start:3 stop:182 length:180 start_codon:yes stop_codon:yes gene_type:complete
LEVLSKAQFNQVNRRLEVLSQRHNHKRRNHNRRSMPNLVAQTHSVPHLCSKEWGRWIKE